MMCDLSKQQDANGDKIQELKIQAKTTKKGLLKAAEDDTVNLRNLKFREKIALLSQPKPEEEKGEEEPQFKPFKAIVGVSVSKGKDPFE